MNRRAARGFTLLELLVALAVLGLLMTSTFGGLRFASRAWSKVAARSDATDDLAARNLLRGTIAQAYPGFVAADLTDRTVAFDGAVDGLAFLAPLPEAIAAGVGARLHFFAAPRGEARALFMAWHFDLPAAGTGEALPDQQVMLLDRVRSVRFDYYGASEESGGAAWQASWSGQQRLPELVRVHVDFADQAHPAWPDLVVGPRPTASPACLYDPVGTLCRRVP